MHSLWLRLTYIIVPNTWLIIESVYFFALLFVLISFRRRRKISMIITCLLAAFMILTEIAGNDSLAGMTADLLFITIFLFFCTDVITQIKKGK